MEDTKRLPVITISRQYAALGRTIARGLQERLGIPFYDKDFVTKTAEMSGYSEEDIVREGEAMSRGAQIMNTLLNNAAVYTSSYDGIYEAQKKVVLELAKEPCIIIGRCADYILEEFKPFRIFVYASIDSKLARCKERSKQGEAFNDREMVRRIQRIDKKRRQHYEFYTGRKWGAKENYDLMINTTDRDIKTLVKGILAIFR